MEEEINIEMENDGKESKIELMKRIEEKGGEGGYIEKMEERIIKIEGKGGIKIIKMEVDEKMNWEVEGIGKKNSKGRMEMIEIYIELKSNDL